MSEVGDYSDIMQFMLNQIVERLSCCCGKNQNREIKKTQTTNMRNALSLIIKCFFSIYQIFASLQSNCKENCEGIRWDIQFTIFAWIVYEFYILFIERYYIINGENDIQFRNTWQKIVELIQNLFFITSQVIIVQENEYQTQDVVAFFFQAFDLILNLCQIWRFPKRLLKHNLYGNDKGGIYFFLLFSIFGQLFTLLLARLYYNQYSSISSTFYDICYICLAIQCTFTIIELLLLFMKCCSDFIHLLNLFCSNFCFNFWQIFLCAVYGLLFGVSSFYFSPVSILIILYVYLQRIFKCRWNYQVIPY